MLSAKKVLLHGMTDKRWTTKDQVTQYKGLVPLYQRDKKIEGHDKVSVLKHQKKYCKRLNRDLVIHRQALDKCLHGDRQKIKNCLEGHREIKLAYQHLPIEEILEHVSQDNFNLRKTLDRLMNKIKLRTQTLIKLKLDVALYEDILKDIQTSNAIENKSKKITAAVQDVILRKEAAIRVGVIYREMIKYMKKDRVYFDAVLYSLHLDTRKQNDCMLQSIKLGQIACEQRNDRFRDYKRVMITVRRYQQLWNSEADKLQFKGVKFTISKSKVIIPFCDRVKDEGPVDQLRELKELEVILNQLKAATNTTNVYDVFPSMESQKKNSIKLKELRDQLEGKRDALHEKVNHANLSFQNYFCTTGDELAYKEEIEELKKTIHLYTKKIEEIASRQTFLNNLCTKLDASITQFDLKCEPLRVTKDYLSTNQPLFEADYKDYPFLKRFDKVISKISYLVSLYPDLELKGVRSRAEAFYANLLKPDRGGNIVTAKRIERYIEFSKAESASIPTRESIKEESIEYAQKAKALLEYAR